MHKDFFELLRRDHEKVRVILAKLEESSADAPQVREELFTKLKLELLPHMRAEEKVFYPALRGQELTQQDALQSFEEHQTTNGLLRDLEHLPKTDGEWGVKLQELRRVLGRHMEDEESEVFLDAKDVLSEDEMRHIYARFTEEKERVRATTAAERVP